MKGQQLLNAISTVAATIDPLIRAGDKKAVTAAVAKLLQLVKEL